MANEIEALKIALLASPKNIELKKIIHQKMLNDYFNYKEELFELSKDIHAEDHDFIPAVESLIKYYFEKGNYTTCDLIIQNYDLDSFTAKGLIQISKVFVELNDNERAANTYKFTTNKFSNAEDDELNLLFRQPTEPTLLKEDSIAFLQKPNLSFDDVGGMLNVKREIDLKIIKPLKNQSLFRKYGKKTGGGILLYGPPGCGKTFIARATAGEIDSNFLSLSLNDILSMWMGNSEKNLHEFFQIARQNSPVVIFIDEIDALGMKRAQFNSSSGRNVVNQLLVEMDGVENDNEGILIIGATNSPWDIDSALRRPGRFDRIIFVPPPDQQSREVILELKLKEKPIAKIDYKLIVDFLSIVDIKID